MTADLHSAVEAADAIAREAGGVLMDFFDSDRVDVRTKGPRDVVTAADAASEPGGPTHPALSRACNRGRGGGNVRGITEYCWFIDPLDATVNYSRSIPLWCVSLSLFREQFRWWEWCTIPSGMRAFALFPKRAFLNGG
jgi:fructose-1,6-bisphosphatase/inositol monophosphatase family enzyme